MNDYTAWCDDWSKNSGFDKHKSEEKKKKLSIKKK